MSEKQSVPVKTDRRIIKTKAAVEDAFGRLLMQKDLSKITISAIAAEANINRKTFYLHYSSVDDLFEGMVTRRIDEIIDDLRVQHRQDPTKLNLANIATELCIILHQDAHENAQLYAHLPLTRIFDLALAPVKNAIMEERIYQNQPEVKNLEVYLRFVLAGAFSVYNHWLVTDSELSREDISSIIRDATVHGIGKLV